MIISQNLSDKTVLRELGQRVTQARLDHNKTQAALAEQAGISKRTLERFEAGESLQLSSFIRIFRALNLTDRFDLLISPTLPSPIAQLKLQGKKRQRASSKTKNKKKSSWVWGDQK